MFGIDDALLLPLIGSAVGAMTSKKPLKGALLGGAAGAMPGLLGAPAAAATNPALIESAVANPMYGASSASPTGLLGGALGALDTYGKPAMMGMSIANKAKQLATPQQAPAPQMMPVQGQDTIGQMLQQQAQLEELRRKARYGIA